MTEGQVFDFLVLCPPVIGIIPITLPELAITESGRCGIVIIAESHISVHSRGTEVYGDIFSCRPFEVGPAIAMARETLGIDGVTVQQLARAAGVQR